VKWGTLIFHFSFGRDLKIISLLSFFDIDYFHTAIIFISQEFFNIKKVVNQNVNNLYGFRFPVLIQIILGGNPNNEYRLLKSESWVTIVKSFFPANFQICLSGKPISFSFLIVVDPKKVSGNY